MTDELDPKALDGSQRPRTVEIAFSTGSYEQTVHSYVLALEAEVRRLRDQPDRDEMVEREWRVAWEDGRATPCGTEDACRELLANARNMFPTKAAVLSPRGTVQSRNVGPWLGAALGPATDQEREGTDG